MDNIEILYPDIWNDIADNKSIGKLLSPRKTYGMFNDSNINRTALDIDVGPIDVILLNNNKVIDRYTVTFQC